MQLSLAQRRTAEPFRPPPIRTRRPKLRRGGLWKFSGRPWDQLGPLGPLHIDRKLNSDRSSRVGNIEDRGAEVVPFRFV